MSQINLNDVENGLHQHPQEELADVGDLYQPENEVESHSLVRRLTSDEQLPPPAVRPEEEVTPRHRSSIEVCFFSFL